MKTSGKTAKKATKMKRLHMWHTLSLQTKPALNIWTNRGHHSRNSSALLEVSKYIKRNYIWWFNVLHTVPKGKRFLQWCWYCFDQYCYFKSLQDKFFATLLHEQWSTYIQTCSTETCSSSKCFFCIPGHNIESVFYW